VRGEAAETVAGLLHNGAAWHSHPRSIA
jgi:hypothetical protein